MLNKQKAYIFTIFLFFLLGTIAAINLKSKEVDSKKTELRILNENSLDSVKKIFYVEIADEDKERQKGLMFVKNMDENEGMFFIFDKEENIYMWMKNTYISLDMIFVNRDLEIVNIVENTTPHSTDIINSELPTKYVLEINAGIAKKHNIKIGDKISF